ncbi:MAG: hypothetical protein KBT03_05085 [Bacteroidales bacterium]|nr:hypothetical protein [Candidatus Scybalousia scybalohippi]
MKKNLLLSIILSLFFSLAFAQEKDNIVSFDTIQGENTWSAEEDYEEYWSMFEVLRQDFLNSPEHRKEKIDCYLRYTKLFLNTVYSQISAPVVYLAYYAFRKTITNRLSNFYQEKNLSNIENIGEDIVQGVVDKEELREYMGDIFYKMWLYGDTKNPIVDGGVPKDYKPSLPMFVRRWLYSGVRNPRWNATYTDNYTNPIVNISTPIDTRKNIITHNYGTSDTKLGTWLRWYVDDKGKWWFLYEKTKPTKENKGKLFYFGVVGLGSHVDGNYPEKTKQGRFEFSLNRTVTISPKN